MLSVQDGGRLEAERVFIARVRQIAVYASTFPMGDSDGVTATLRDVVIAETQAGSGALDLRAGRVVESEIRIDVQGEGLDFDALTAELRCERDVCTADVRILPVPEPVLPAPLLR